VTENWTVLKVLRWTSDYLDSKGVDNPRLDAELLIGSALDKDRVGLYLCYDQPLLADELTHIHQLVARRAQREPVQYILGQTEFWSLKFEVSPSVLIPRGDSEILVEEALRLINGADSHSCDSVLDIGTGSGAIAIAIAHEFMHATEQRQLQVDAIDVSLQALQVARANAEHNAVGQRINFYQHDMAELNNFVTEHIEGGYGLIVSNPPYISSAEMNDLMPEVSQHEPHLALEAGEDGLDCYKLLSAQAMIALQPLGWLAVEVGATQAQAVQHLFEQAGLSNIFTRTDYSGITRVVGAQKTGSED